MSRTVFLRAYRFGTPQIFPPDQLGFFVIQPSIQNRKSQFSKSISYKSAEILDQPVVILPRRSTIRHVGHAPRAKLLIDGNGRKKSSSVSFLLHKIPYCIGHGTLKAAVDWTRGAFVEGTEQSAHQQLDHDFVRPLLNFPLVAVARVADTLGDISDPVKALHSFECRSMFWGRNSANEFFQLTVEKSVVLLRVEAVVGLDQLQPGEQIGMYEPF